MQLARRSTLTMRIAQMTGNVSPAKIWPTMESEMESYQDKMIREAQRKQRARLTECAAWFILGATHVGMLWHIFTF